MSSLKVKRLGALIVVLLIVLVITFFTKMPYDSFMNVQNGDSPVHCEVGPWSAWVPSDPQDGINMRKRTRKVVLGNGNGTPCSAEQSRTIEYKPCNSEKIQLPDLLDLQEKGFSGIKVFYQK